MGSSLVLAALLEDNLFKISINTADIASCIIHSKAFMLDDIESAAQPRWDDDWRHKYATGLDQFVRLIELSPDGNINFDHHAWGDSSNRYTRHSMTGVRGGEHVRLGHKFKCGFLERNYHLPVRYAPPEIEVTLVSDLFTPIIQPVPTAAATAQGGDREGYYFTEGDTSTLWALNNSLILQAEVVSLDAEAKNNITRHLLKGGTLKIVYPMYHTLSQTFNTNGTEIHIIHKVYQNIGIS